MGEYLKNKYIEKACNKTNKKCVKLKLFNIEIIITF